MIFSNPVASESGTSVRCSQMDLLMSMVYVFTLKERKKFTWKWSRLIQ